MFLDVTDFIGYLMVRNTTTLQPAWNCANRVFECYSESVWRQQRNCIL